MKVEVQKAFLEDKAALRNLLELYRGEAIHSIAEFFIMRKYRWQGMGQAVAFYIFDLFPGRWWVAQTEANRQASFLGIRAGRFEEIRRDDWKGPVREFSTPSI